jgi:hypothetical protein
LSHPLISLASHKEVRQAAGFRAKAGELGGERLEAAYGEEKRNAPSLADAGRRYLTPRGGKPATERRRGKDEEHVAMALVRYGQARGDGLPLPDESLRLLPLEAQVRVKSGPADAPETKGIGRIDLLGITSDDRLVVAKLRVLEPSETRCGVGDTPLRSFLEALALCAIAEANLPALRTEISERFGRTLSDAPPMLVLLASSVYWRLCRRRESQRGAGWIREMERLAQEVERDLSVPVRFLSLELPGDPGWVYREDGPAIDGIPRLTLAWEPGAGRVRPKAKPRQKKPSAPEIVVVVADPSRPPRRYTVAESYRSGDRIEHPTLGVGVVQGSAGNGKIRVRFNDRDSVLVHERGGVSVTPGA